MLGTTGLRLLFIIDVKTEMNVALLYKFFEGSTSEKENKQIKAWLEASPDHKKYFDNERRVFDSIVLNSKELYVRRISGSSKKFRGWRGCIFISATETIRMGVAVLLALAGSWNFFSFHKNEEQVTMHRISVPASRCRANIDGQTPCGEIEKIACPGHDQSAIERATRNSSYRWEEGLISLKKESFSETVNSPERISDMPVMIDNTALEDVIRTGRFRIGDSAGYALRVRERKAGLTLERNVDDQTIHIRQRYDIPIQSPSK